jgi:hypothetical protein
VHNISEYDALPCGDSLLVPSWPTNSSFTLCQLSITASSFLPATTRAYQALMTRDAVNHVHLWGGYLLNTAENRNLKNTMSEWHLVADIIILIRLNNFGYWVKHRTVKVSFFSDTGLKDEWWFAEHWDCLNKARCCEVALRSVTTTFGRDVHPLPLLLQLELLAEWNKACRGL